MKKYKYEKTQGIKRIILFIVELFVNVPLFFGVFCFLLLFFLNIKPSSERLNM